MKKKPITLLIFILILIIGGLLTYLIIEKNSLSSSNSKKEETNSNVDNKYLGTYYSSTYFIKLKQNNKSYIHLHNKCSNVKGNKEIADEYDYKIVDNTLKIDLNKDGSFTETFNILKDENENYTFKGQGNACINADYLELKKNTTATNLIKNYYSVRYEYPYDSELDTTPTETIHLSLLENGAFYIVHLHSEGAPWGWIGTYEIKDNDLILNTKYSHGSGCGLEPASKVINLKTDGNSVIYNHNDIDMKLTKNSEFTGTVLNEGLFCDEIEESILNDAKQLMGNYR